MFKQSVTYPCRWLCCYLVAALALLPAACTTDDDSTGNPANNEPLTIAVSEQPWQTENFSITRSGETLTALQASGFGLYSEGLGIGNEQVTWSGTKWILAHTLIWPKTRPNDFYAYAPYTATPAITSGVYNFSCPNDNTTDLLYSKYEGIDGDAVRLIFRHALAKLSFGTIANSSARDMLVSDIKVTGDLYSSGKLTLSTGAWSEQATASGQTIQIIPNTQFIYIPPQGENPVRSSVSPLLIPEPTVTVSYKVYNERTDFDKLTDDNFHSWNWTKNGVEDVANATMTSSLDGNYVSRIGTTVNAGQEVCGTATVSYLTYADISAYDKMIITGTSGMVVRVLLNRKKVGDGGGDSYGGGIEEIFAAINEDGYAVVNLSAVSTSYGYLHLNAIKVNWGSPSGTVTKVLLVKTDHPHTVSGTTVLEQGKEKAFHLNVGVNHEVVISN